MPIGAVLIIFSQPSQSSEMWISTGIWDHAGTTRQERKRWWEAMSVAVQERAEPGQALLQESGGSGEGEAVLATTAGSAALASPWSQTDCSYDFSLCGIIS